MRWGVCLALWIATCSPAVPRAPEPSGDGGGAAAGAARVREGADARARERARMVDRQIAARGIDDPRVLEAMRRVPRHRFVPEDWASLAYDDRPLPIGHDQTISQPFIVALMSLLADVEPGDRVLEVGTGSGYQAAVLAELGAEVYTIEIVEPLARESAARLAALGYERVHARHGDGYRGWAEHAPFDAVVVTAAPPEVPPPLVAQLAQGGRLVLPVGRRDQMLKVLVKGPEGLVEQEVVPVAFVPMTGEAQDGPPREAPDAGQ